jgi:hypothetical protein
MSSSSGRYTAFFDEMQKIAAKQAVTGKPLPKLVVNPIKSFSKKQNFLEQAVKLYKKSPVKLDFSSKWNRPYAGLTVGGKF